ncbi:MAG: hypothetical protein WKG00_05260 [Polyangiaceae bacterium]
MNLKTCGVLALAGIVSSVVVTWHLVPLLRQERQADLARTTGNLRVTALVASSLRDAPRGDGTLAAPQEQPHADPARPRNVAATPAAPGGVAGPLVLKMF